MPEQIPQFIVPKNMRAQGSPFIWLFWLATGSTIPSAYRFTANNTAVFFDADSSGNPLEWTPGNITFGEFEITSDGSLPSFDIGIGGGLGGLMQTILNDPDLLIGQDFDIYRVHEDQLGDPSAKSSFEGTVTNIHAAVDAVVFTISSEDLLDVPVPNSVLDPLRCQRQYGDRGCGFQIAVHDPDLTSLGACPKTRPACRLRGDLEVANGAVRLHPKRFFAFPGMLVR